MQETVMTMTNRYVCLEVPEYAYRVEDVLHITYEIKYLTWRLRNANRYIRELDRLERAYGTMESSSVSVSKDDYDKAVKVLGREILDAFNSTK
jgi:hypothetical protein